MEKKSSNSLYHLIPQIVISPVNKLYVIFQALLTTLALMSQNISWNLRMIFNAQCEENAKYYTITKLLTTNNL